MKIINVCGFNLSGCSAAFDLFYDYQTLGSVNREFHESGFLKSKYSFGGAIQSVLLDLPFRPTRAELFASLQGEMPATFEGDPNTLSVHNHLVSRKSMASQFGSVFSDITETSLAIIPENVYDLNNEDALKAYEHAAVNWLEAIIECVPEENFHLKKKLPDSIMIFKNDPPGKFPYMARLIPNGISFAVLRDPVDACFDYNRFYHLGHSEQTVKDYSQIFGSWVRTVKNQLGRDLESIRGKYYMVRFEDLILKTEVRQTMLDMVGLTHVPKISNHFRPDESTRNIRIGQVLSPELIKLIQSLCMPEYDSIVELLRSNKMLIDA
jgi:hypothetical protein